MDDATTASGGRVFDGSGDCPAGSRPPEQGKVSLADQILEIEKEIRDRAQRRFPYAVKTGKLLPETAERTLAVMRAVHNTFIWLEANEVWIRAEATRRAQRAALADHPAVTAVLEAFPGAEIDGT